MTFIAWMLDRSARMGDPVSNWDIPWAVEVTSATKLRRDVGVVTRIRSGWRLILTFHGKPVAMIVPVAQPRGSDEGEARSKGRDTSDAGCTSAQSE
jgi:antitoxin (DNA-binding transcriptional repressor) of toxin-antitoxin stability system